MEARSTNRAGFWAGELDHVKWFFIFTNPSGTELEPDCQRAYAMEST